MIIGDLKKRVTLQSPTRTADGMSGFTVSWKDEGSVWAAIWPLSASEQVQGMQSAMTISGRVRIWYRADLKASWRLKYKNRYFNIVSIVNPNEAGVYLDLLVKEAS